MFQPPHLPLYHARGMNLRVRPRVKVIFSFVSFLQFSTVPLGSIAELPAETCYEIKNSEGKAPGGNYWLSAINSSMPVLTYCNLEGKISTKYLAPIPTNILSLRSLGMGISTLLGAHGGQFGRSRENTCTVATASQLEFRGQRFFLCLSPFII